jgi:polar amino acid transport system substrate-binding protein
MNKRNIFIFSLFVALLLMVSLAVEAKIFDEIESRGTIRIGINTRTKPFTFRDDNGEPAGMCIDLGKLIAENMGVEVEFIDLEWGGLIPALIAGRIDIFGDTVSNTLERAKSIAFTDSWFQTGTVVYTRKDSPYKTLEDINKKGVKTAVILGAIGEPTARRVLYNTEVIAFDNTTDVTQALLTNRADIALEDEIIAYAQVDTAPDELMVIPGYLVVDTYSFGVRHEDTELLRWLNLFFEKIKRSGEFQEIYKKWLEREWVPVPQKQL